MRLALLYEKTHCSVVAMLMAILKDLKTHLANQQRRFAGLRREILLN